MTVKELIEILQQEDQDRIVICQRDPEGNGFSPLSCVDTGAYLAETTWSGERGIERLTGDLEELGFTEEDILSGAVPALFLIPVN